ncbi:hypothetical protein [Sphaerisporangium perillae]|uniref:hypothetical protein n=1 Tax=Sphaerisporangium perillae TaxID=2935860 RepID=UPI002010965D|nr:hypothetical protein [Sphaerisporangium perillae]
MRLLLIRHGQTPSYVAGELDAAFPGAGLTVLGQAQARPVTAERGEKRIGGVYAFSPGPHPAHRGAARAGRAGGGGVPGDLAGALEMRSDEETVRGHRECLAAWMHGDLCRGSLTGTRSWGGTTRRCGPSANVMAIRMWSTLLAGAAHDVTGESTEEAVADASSWRFATHLWACRT